MKGNKLLFCFYKIIERPSKTVMLASFTMMCLLWSCFASFGSDENFLDRIKRSAEAGISVSQLTLANIYAEGSHGVRKNTEAKNKMVLPFSLIGNQMHRYFWLMLSGREKVFKKI